MAFASVLAMSVSAQAGCRNEKIESASYVICEFKAGDGIELFLRDAQGGPLGQSAVCRTP